MADQMADGGWQMADEAVIDADGLVDSRKGSAGSPGAVDGVKPDDKRRERRASSPYARVRGNSSRSRAGRMTGEVDGGLDSGHEGRVETSTSMLI